MTKKLSLSIFFFLLIIPVLAQVSNTSVSDNRILISYSNGFAKDKWFGKGPSNTVKMPGERMKKTGAILTVSGLVLVFLGGVLTYSVKSDRENVNQNRYQYYNAEEESGFRRREKIASIVTVLGIGMTTPGIILWSNGTRDYNDQKKRQNLSLGIKPNGLSLKLLF